MRQSHSRTIFGMSDSVKIPTVKVETKNKRGETTDTDTNSETGISKRQRRPPVLQAGGSSSVFLRRKQSPHRTCFSRICRKNKDCMIIYGNSRSNLCRVLANLCCAEKSPCYMICSSEENEGTTDRNQQQPSDEMKAGAEVIPCRKNRDCTDRRADDEPFGQRGDITHIIFSGDKFGTGNEGTPVQATGRLPREILAWEKQNISFLISLQHPEPARPRVRPGFESGNTRAGNGADHRPFRFHPASRPSHPHHGERHFRFIILRRIISCCRKDGESELHLEMGYRQGGYGQYDEADFTGDPGRNSAGTAFRWIDVHRKGIHRE